MAEVRLLLVRDITMHPRSDVPLHDPSPSAQADEYLHARVSAEFREMPGLTLTLTLAQAARLFSLDSARCERVFGTLVERGILSTNGRAFARPDAGRRAV